MKKTIVLLLSVFVLGSCMKDKENQAPTNELLIGVWTNAIYKDGYLKLSKADELADDSYGFTFFEDGTFLEQKNAGWCGTPPVSYLDYYGNYEVMSDSIIEIEVGYWGGRTTFDIFIRTLNDSKIEIEYRNILYL